MQDRYVADVGDFGKFQLFRFLFNHHESPLYNKQLAQIWFLHSGEGEKNNDGTHIDYFERMSGSDKYLENSMMDILMRNRREVEEIERLKLLQNAKFFTHHIPKSLEDRYLWLNTALTFAIHSPIVAVAPDNGIALRCNRIEKSFDFLSLGQHFSQKPYPHKYIFAEEISYFYRLPHLEVCIVYQHLGRCFSHHEQIMTLLQKLNRSYDHIVAIKHKPYSPRIFFFLCKSEIIKESVGYRLKQFEERFSQFWEVYL